MLRTEVTSKISRVQLYINCPNHRVAFGLILTVIITWITKGKAMQA